MYCIYVCIDVHKYVYIYAHTHAHTHTHASIVSYTCMYLIRCSGYWYQSQTCLCTATKCTRARPVQINRPRAV